MASTSFHHLLGFTLIFCLAFIPSYAKFSREHEPYRIPKIYQPSEQIINLTYYAVDLKFEGETTIYVENIDQQSLRNITIHAYQLNITKLEVSTIEGCPIYSYFELIDSEETLIIHLKTKEHYRKLKIYIEYKFEVTPWTTTGVYAPTSNTGSPYELVTLFQPSFARKVFPTFDDPYFRFNFTFSLKILQDPNGTLDTVLFNAPLKSQFSNISNIEEREYHFEQTVPLPAYLVAFAVLKSDQHKKLLEFDYFGIPIRFYQLYPISFLGHKEIRETVQQIVQFTLSYCESRFEIRWKLSKKIDFLLTNTRKGLGGMENVGLITMSSLTYSFCTVYSIRRCENAYTTIIHELIHQWTGGLMTNEWWSNFWLNEGFTTFFQSEITRALVKFKRLSINANSIVLTPHSLKEMAIHNSRNVLAADDFNFFGFSVDFYHKAGYAVSLLDAAMNDNLMVCMGVILAKFPYQSMTAKFVVDQLTDCPYSTVNATEFMRFWLFDEKIPILKIEIRGSKATKFQNKVNKALITYSFLCSSFKKLEKGECRERESNFQPHFAVVFRDINNHVLQNPIIINENNSIANLYFDLEANPLYFINAYDQGNFLVHYPDDVYQSFFDWLNKKIFAYKIKLAPFYKVFTMDMFELSRRGRISLNWLYTILQNQIRLSRAGIVDMNQLEDFEKCVDYNLFVKLPPNATIQKFSCYWRPFIIETTCEDRWRDLNKFRENNGTEECKTWIGMFGKKFEKVLEENYDSAEFFYPKEYDEF